MAPTLKELWISYNEISTLEGIKDCTKLRVLYIGNNLIVSYNDLNVLNNLVNLEDAVFKGNPFCLIDGNIQKPVEKPYNEIVPEIKKKIPSLITLDGELCKNYETTQI